jgi:hypothetical protein
MTDDTNDECQTCTFWQRVGRYLLLRAKEPTTYAGLTVIATGLGIHISPDRWAAIATAGTFIAGFLLTVTKEGRNKPDNPSLTATLKGEMPPANPAIVPPAPTSDLPTTAIDPKRVPVAADGELQAPQK